MSTQSISSPVSFRRSDQTNPQDPKQAAKQIMEVHDAESEWLDAFMEQIDRQRSAEALKRILSIWQLNQSDAAQVFGVSRQAISKWFIGGVPANRAVALADLGAATDLLIRHLKRDRVAGVVRRKANNLGNRSLLEMVYANEFNTVLSACRTMFAFGQA